MNENRRVLWAAVADEADQQQTCGEVAGAAKIGNRSLRRACLMGWSYHRMPAVMGMYAVLPFNDVSVKFSCDFVSIQT